MSCPVLWPKKVFSYPIGKTPPMCLTETLPPEQRADILLLGCGDLKNVLYTTFCDLGADRQIDVTCCDADPTILARNVFIYTLLLDGNLDSLLSTIWDVFYHFYIDDESLALVSSHCRRLLDSSSALDSWHASKYGRFLRFCTHHTLMELQRHWKGYLETANASPAEKENLFDLFTAGMRDPRAKERFYGLVLRAAGPLRPGIEAAGQDLYQYFRTNGVTTSNAAVSSKYLHANPLFAYSLVGKGFAMHHGTEPVSSFHLMTPLASNSTSGPTKIQDLADFARSEFSTWCRAFADHIANRKIIIRLFAGDALSFAHALHYYSKTGDPETHVYTSSWGNSLIKLYREDYSDTGSAPSSFNVIDTSNLSDRLGMLNLLTACLPLLQVSASATLQTSTTLHPSLQDASSTSPDPLRGDFAALSSLFGITSITHISEFVTSFSGSDFVSGAQPYERISWKWTEFIGSTVNCARYHVTLEFDAKQLAVFLYNTHQRMFTEENSDQPDAVKILYTRTSFSFLLVAVMTRTRQIWSDVLSHLVSLIGSGQQPFSMSTYRYQDFCCQLHIQNMYSVKNIRSPPLLGSQTDLSLFKKYPAIPPLTCIVLRIPRKKINFIEKMHIGTSILYCQVEGPGCLDTFTSIRPTLGDINVTDGVIAVNDDPQGWSGNSPLVVSFWVPSWILTINPSRISINLCFEPTPDALRNFLSTLGEGLCILAAPLQDQEHVFISSQRPGNERELECHKKMLPFQDATSPNPSEVLVQVALDPTAQQVSKFTMRKGVTADAARLSLSDRAAIATTQISSCALCIAFGSHEIIYSFPFPVDGSKSITRVARSSFYIEVEVPISSPRLPGGFMFQRFPIIKEGTTPTIWNIPYVKLDSMPRLGLENPWKLKWLESIILSLRATDVTVSATGTWSGGQDVFSKVKRTMSTLLYYAAGIQAQGPKKWFSLGLIEPTNVVKLSAILFIDGLRLDSASQTVVIDACVLCLTPAVIDRLHLILRSSKCTTNISADPPEIGAWAHLFPVFAERCRTWKHTAKCEYISGTIPLSTDLGNDPLCSCGRGIGVLFPDEWKEWNELAPLFTRIAISPTFPLHPFDILGCARPLILEKTAQHLTPSACCTACNGPGKPELLACSACKQIKYCSAACQKNHWKVHKVQCKMVKRANVL